MKTVIGGGAPAKAGAAGGVMGTITGAIGIAKGDKGRALAIGIAAIVLLTLPMWGSGYAVMMIKLMGCYITLGYMWNLLAGYSGLVSLGQQMYFALGAYTLAVTTEKLGIPIIVGMILGGLVSMVIAIGLSYLLLRMRGMYFAIATWMFSEAMVLVVVNMDWLEKGNGVYIKAARALDSVGKYYFSVIMFLVVTVVMILLLRSKLGLGLFAIRDNDSAASTSGVPLFRSKLSVMMIASFITGFAGGVYYIDPIWVQPYAAFNISWTVAAVFIVVIGGIGTISGPIVGGVIYVFLSQYLATLESIGSLNMVILGVIAVAVILAAPKGIVGTLQERTGFEVISARRWLRMYEGN